MKMETSGINLNLTEKEIYAMYFALEYFSSNYEGKYEWAVRTPCNRHCDVEWCSRICFERRGYMWNYNGHGWLRDDNGNKMIGKAECDWVPGDEEDEY